MTQTTQLSFEKRMEAVGVESAGRFLKDRNFGDLENIFSSFFLFHAICVTPTAHYSDRMVPEAKADSGGGFTLFEILVQGSLVLPKPIGMIALASPFGKNRHHAIVARQSRHI